ncbi:MAG: amino acid adenylation domain-containing protein [Tildeniella nuda ZEHNDER 1965/U140]|jgi:amino acid adenylation domain-containing protein|nr:amino acid adenylation domain-containing protein [Tildeniella nuda ZEHNDER 1965/U140]
MVATNERSVSLTENLVIKPEPTSVPIDLLTVSAPTQPSILIQDDDRQTVPQQKIVLEKTDDRDHSVVQLPSDFLKTPTTTYQPKYCALTLPDQLIKALQAQAQHDDIDERSFLLAAFNALLYRYTQQETIDLELTLPIKKTNGTDTVEICSQLHSELSVHALIGQISTTLNDVQYSLNTPSLQAQPDAPFNARRSLPIAVTFVEDFFRIEGKEQLVSEFQPQTSVASDYPDLHLIILQQENSVSGLLQYNASLFQAETIQRLAGHLQLLLQGMVDDRDSSIAQLPLLTQAERQQLAGWQSTTVSHPQTPIHQYIEAHAIQQPEAIALRFKNQQLTYAELNQRANQLAHYLTQIGVGAEVRVAVCVEPSLDVAVSLLGVFKAGGVYVPLDATYPTERLAAILEETQPKVLLTQAHLLPQLPALAEHSLCLDRDWATLHPFPTHNPASEINLNQTSHLIYTSGTTGQPKGVATSYGNLVQYILVAQERFGFDQHDVMPAIARFTFSITMFELLSPLVAGGTLVLLEREHILDFKRLTQTLAQLTVIHTSPSLLQKLLAYIQDNHLDLKLFQHLKHVSTGGDMVPAALLDTMKRVFQQAEIYVIYGCSEVSCMGCTYPVTRDQQVTKSRVGKPFPNVVVRLYDAHQKQVPIGIPGEIYIGGAGVTKGYLQREALTQEKFVTIEGQRFYRTGDLGRLDADGNLEMLGRTDFQVKLRGIRIELGEIEATLRQVPGVREGIVTARELWNGERGLVAYVVLDHDQPLVEEIRRFLQTKLPDYMIPAAFVVLEAMPVNINQKVDRCALPAPDFVGTGLDNASYIAPRNPLETLLSDIWAKTLGLEQIGIQDDFFALGGHSLLAAQMIARLQSAASLELSISRLFEFPTIAALAEHLAPDGQIDSTACAVVDPIVPTSRETDLPLSSSQEQLWFLSQLEGGGVAYNIPSAFKLVGALHLTALEQALTEILQRHESLRTTFPIVNAAPVQRILPPQPFPLPVVDLQTLPESEQMVAVDRLIREDAQCPFRLADDVPLRGKLLRLSETAYILLLTMHHIASDGWSLAVFRRELAALYTSFSQGLASPLEALPIQYADFADWQRQWLQGDSLSQQVVYWQQQLAGAPTLLELPTDRSRPPMQSFRGGTESFVLDAKLTHQLKTLSQRSGATLFMTLLSAFAVLLSRYSGQHDMVIGTPIANRKRSEIEPLIGFFINLLSLRVNLTGNPGFLELLKRVRQVSLDAYAHQDVPFEQVVEVLQPERNLSYSPLFQVLLILQNTPAEPLDLPDLTLTPLKVDSGVSKYDLTLMLEETEAGLVAEFEYNGDLFDATTIDRMIGHFKVLLQAIVTHPEQPIAALPLLTEPERDQLLTTWNHTPLAYPQAQCIHQLFEAQVEQTPEAIAVVFEQQSLTYRELNCRANQLAHYLQALGVGPDALVGICVERSLEMVVGLLGILKAGGSYVPLDPAYPKDRLTFMLEDSQLPLLLTQQTLCDQFSEQPVQVICLDTDWEAIAPHGTDNPNSTVAPEHLAYTIYTSGSTGKPKGVQIPHSAAVNFLNSMRQQPGLTEHDILLAVTTISFDIAVLELYLPLMVGARIVLVKREDAADAAQLTKLLASSNATFMQATPATWQMLIAHGWLGDRRLKMLCGGEAMPREMANQLLARGGSLWNMYGPTETTVWSSVSQVEPGSGSVPVGGPIANTQIYVLEAPTDTQQGSMRPVPIGIPGEVHIGGDGLARGYLNRPELTQERFVADPFSAKPGARLYKTGDLARYRPDGTLEFLGRLDHQVKLRGFRIELGEIEAILNHHSAVKQAVVVVREDTPGDQRLVAYLTTQSKVVPTALELRHFLKEQLPGYMVPATFSTLEALPLTPNGKVDRRALPVPAMSTEEQDCRTCVAPRDEVERQLIEVWQDVLNIKPISIKDNFFDLGGHSLSAVRVCAQVEKVFGKSLPITTLLQSPTVEEIATILRKTETEETEESVGDLVPLRAGGSKPPLFCIYGILLYRDLVDQLDVDQPVYGVYLQEEVDLLKPDNIDERAAIFSSVPAIAARYLQVIRTLQPHGPYYLAGECFGGIVAFEMAHQLTALGEEVALVGLLDAWAPNSQIALSLLQRLTLHGQLLLRLGLPYALELLQQNLEELKLQVKARLYKLREQLPFAGKVPEMLSESMQRSISGEMRQQAIQSYVPKPYAGRMVLFRATERDVFEKDDRDMGWTSLAAGGLQLFDVPGDHLGILKAPNVQVLANQLRSFLG